MTAPKTTTDIRTDVTVKIALSAATAVVSALGDAMWWEEDVYLDIAESNALQALEYVQMAKKNFADRKQKP